MQPGRHTLRLRLDPQALAAAAAASAPRARRDRRRRRRRRRRRHGHDRRRHGRDRTARGEARASAARALARRRWWRWSRRSLAAAALAPAVTGGARRRARSSPQPVLGAADREHEADGRRADAGGEVWGYRAAAARRSAPPVVDGKPLEFGPAGAATRRAARLPALDARRPAGRSSRRRSTSRAARYRGPIPNPRSARVTPARRRRCWSGRDRRRAGATCAGRRSLRARSRAGAFRRRCPTPPARRRCEPGEALAEDAAPGRAAVDRVRPRRQDGRASSAPRARRSRRAVVYCDGEAWTREPVELPGRTPSAGFQIARRSPPTGADNAWLLARADAGARARRRAVRARHGDGGPRWVERSLGDAPFATRADAGARRRRACEPLGDARSR